MSFKIINLEKFQIRKHLKAVLMLQAAEKANCRSEKHRTMVNLWASVPIRFRMRHQGRSGKNSISLEMDF